MENIKINQNIYDYILNQNQKEKNRIAIDYFGRKYTFNDVEKNIDVIMKSLNEIGIKEGDNAVILGLATPEFVFLMYALAKMNIMFNILNPLDNESYDSIIKRLNPKLMFCYDAFYEKVLGKIEASRVVITSPFDSLPVPIKVVGKLKSPVISKKCIKYKDFIALGKKSKKELRLDNKYVPDQKIIEIGTGGSTGIPKQVGISNEMLNNVVYQHELMNKYKCFDVSFSDGETFLDIIPPHLAYGICDIHLALSLRLKLCLEPNPEPKMFVKQLKIHKPHHVLAGPVHWKELIAYKNKVDLSNIKNAVAGGEHLENDDEIKTNKKLKEYGSKATVREGVGLTEICGVGTYNSSGDLFTVGRPLPEYQVGIFKVDMDEEHSDNTHLSDELCKVYYKKQQDGELEIVLTGINSITSSGEICYQLPIKILGYIGEEYKEENNLLIRLHEDGKYWIHTGDVGYINEKRNLVITDRIKRVFSRNGWKIYPNRISKVVTDSGLVKECTVIKRESLVKGESYVPILYVVLKDNSQVNEEKLVEWCDQKVTGNSKLYDIIFINELPKTGAGKVNFNQVERYDKENNPVVSDKEENSKKVRIKRITLDDFYKNNQKK